MATKLICPETQHECTGTCTPEKGVHICHCPKSLAWAGVGECRCKQLLPSAATLLPTDAKDRKDTPIGTGVLDYFGAALAEIARVSKAGNDQHNPGQPLHWAWGKSSDHYDCATRHLLDRGTKDTDGMRHTAKAAWRVLALLTEELVKEGAPLPRAAKVPS